MRSPSIRIEPDDPPARVNELTTRQFYNFVDQDVRNRLEDRVSAKLRDSVVVERWYFALIQMKKNVESQLSASKSDFKADQQNLLRRMETADDASARVLRQAHSEMIEKYQQARAKKIRFRSAVDERLTEATYLRLSLLRADARLRAAVFEQAIRHHQESIDVDDASDEDLALWSTLAL